MEDGMKILVAYDGSDDSERAVKEAAQLAKKFSGSVTVLNVYWDPTEESHASELDRTEGIQVMDRGSLRILDDIEPYLKKSGASYELRTERSPNVPKTILRIAEDEGYGCIAMGTRGQGGARSWLLGSVSLKVIAEAECPVVAI
jgi:nucleotide-binding universal stress UspA family protein